MEESPTTTPSLPAPAPVALTPPPAAPPERSLSFEEFRLMYQSAEHSTQRKDDLNRSNAQLCTLVVGSQGVIAGWAYGKGIVEYLGAGTCFIVSVLGVMLCINWLEQIKSLKNLTGAKFSVMDEMSGRISFPDYKERQISSYNPFQREWEIMEQNKALQSFGSGKAMNSTKSEIAIPRMFRIFFTITAAAAVSIILAKLSGIDFVVDALKSVKQ